MRRVGLIFNVGVGANVVRLFRVGRIFRIIRRARALRHIFETLMYSTSVSLSIVCLAFNISAVKNIHTSRMAPLKGTGTAACSFALREIWSGCSRNTPACYVVCM